jgi:hypothetical protein
LSDEQYKSIVEKAGGFRGVSPLVNMERENDKMSKEAAMMKKEREESM